MPVTAPEDKRFWRATARPASRRRRHHLTRLLTLTLPVLVVALVVAVGYGVTQVVLASPRFAVQRIVVRGHHRLSAGEVKALLEGLAGQNLIRADLGEWRDRVLDSPWVSAAELRRVIPGTVEVAIVERVPLGLGRVGGRLYLLDERGAAIDEYGPQYADLDLPIIDGLIEVPELARAARAGLACRVTSALAARPELVRRLSQLDVSDARDAVVILDDDPARLHLGDDDFVARLSSYIELAPALRSRVPVIDYVDLRFDSRVFVRPSAAAEASGTPAAPERQPALP